MSRQINRVHTDEEGGRNKAATGAQSSDGKGEMGGVLSKNREAQ